MGSSPRPRRAGAIAAQPSDGAGAGAATCSAGGTLLQAQVPSGELVVRPIQEGDVRGAAVLLARAFVNSPEAVSLEEATAYMSKQLAAPELGVTLVARLVPADASLLPKGQASRLVGTVRLAFDLADASRSDGLARLRELPQGSAYLSNMAVDPKLRRQGIARTMLAACDAAAVAGPLGSSSGGSGGGAAAIYLHVRDGDSPAAALYASYGYKEVEREPGGGGGLFGGLAFGKAPQRRPRVLMQRTIGGGSGGGGT